MQHGSIRIHQARLDGTFPNDHVCDRSATRRRRIERIHNTYDRLRFGYHRNN